MIKRKLKKAISIILTMSIILTIVVAFITNPIKVKKQNDTKFLIGMSQANLSEPWRVTMNHEIENESGKYDDLKVIFTDAGSSTSKQVDDVKKLLSYGIDLLIISMNDAKELTPVIKEVYKKIPVIVLDRAVEGYDYTLFIGPDNESIGKETGRRIESILKNSGNIVEIQGLEGSPLVKDRSEGVKQILENSEGIKLKQTLVADWQRDKAEDEFAKTIKNNSNINLVFAQSDDMALGAYRAAIKLGIHNINFLGVDGLDGTNGGLDLVKRGILKGTFVCPTGGKEAIQYAIRILNNQFPVPKKIILKAHEITPDNINEYLAQLNVPPKKKQGKLVLGFAQVGDESGWRVANTKSIQQAAASANIELKMNFANGDKKEQIKNIEKLIDEGVDVIAFPPLVENGFDEVLAKAKAKGIPVILCDRRVNTDNENLWDSFIGSDFVEEGRRAARWLTENYANKAQVNIVEIEGTLAADPTIGRKQGFQQVLEGNSKFNITASVSGDFRMDTGKKAMAGLLKENKKIDVVYAHNDDMALGAVEAIEEAGLKPGKDIAVISIDGTRTALSALRTGKMDCVVECNPLLGPQIMQVVKELGEGKEIPKQIITQEKVFTQDNVGQELYDREY